MVQRIQTVYTLLVMVFSLLAIFSFSVWTDASKTPVLARSIPVLWVSFSAVAVLAFYSLFNFKNRQLQFVINRIN
ncbi:MAG: DUF4293 family protein, partial [Flavobacteriaceae bacterium]|nr:DUF4293 family protein [Flavobacteriaceae bacterium]